MFDIFCTVYYENYKGGLIKGKIKKYKVCKKKHRTTTERRKKSHVLENAMQAEYCNTFIIINVMSKDINIKREFRRSLGNYTT